MKHEGEPSVAGCLVAALLVYVALSVLGPCRSPDPNVELARTAREAVAMARETQRDSERARRANNAMRVLALAAGVCVPLIVVYLVYKLRERSETPVEEVLDVLERHELLTEGKPEQHALPVTRPREVEGESTSPEADDQR